MVSHLDPPQIIKRAYDETLNRIRVDAEVTANIAGVQEVAITHVDDSIRLGDGVDLVDVTDINGKIGLDVNVLNDTLTGEFTQTGLKTQGKITTLDITDTVSPIPATALVGRNSLSLTNLSTTDTLYVGFNTNVTASRALGVNAGWEVGPNEGFNLDIQDDIIIYGITETGVTVRVKIMELA